MFQTACELLFRHCAILPIETSIRKVSGKVSYGVGAGILVNRDGWILTAGHILKHLRSSDKAKEAATVHRKRAEEIKNTANLSHKEKQKQLRELGMINPNCPTNISCRVGQQEHRNETPDLNFVIFDEADLGVFKLDNFKVPEGYTQPYFRKEPLRVGEMVCRIGYPFHKSDVRWDEQNERFLSMDEEILPFANEGIVSRFIAEPAVSGELPIRFIETGSPGLRGQSGGPLLDKEGRICGIQSHTMSYPLGFSPQEDGQTEHQFLNVGRSSQVSEIFQLLDDVGIPYYSQ